VSIQLIPRSSASHSAAWRVASSASISNPPTAPAPKTTSDISSPVVPNFLRFTQLLPAISACPAAPRRIMDCPRQLSF